MELLKGTAPTHKSYGRDMSEIYFFIFVSCEALSKAGLKHVHCSQLVGKCM